MGSQCIYLLDSPLSVVRDELFFERCGRVANLFVSLVDRLWSVSGARAQTSTRGDYRNDIIRRRCIAYQLPVHNSARRLLALCRIDIVSVRLCGAVRLPTWGFGIKAKNSDDLDAGIFRGRSGVPQQRYA